MPKVSVIVPVYKVENYIRKCVDSICNQTLTDIEIILVDDGSPDQCGKICDEYREKDPRIKVIHKKNGGLSDARNAGLKIVTGDYIGFVDSDDYIAPNMFEMLYLLCQKNHTLISGCDLAYVYDGIDGKVDALSSGETSILSSHDFFRKMLDVQAFLRTGVWNKLYKTELFKEVRFPKGKVFEDVGTMYKLIFQAECISYISVPGYYYLKQREGAITNQKYSAKEYDRLEMNDAMVEYIRNNQPELLPTVMGYRAINCHLSIVNSLIASNCRDEKMISILKADIKKNIKYILKSEQTVEKKCQVILFLAGFDFYRVVFNTLKR